MTEVLGIAASSINVAQLAGQVASCVIKLKCFWDQVKEAPDDIKQALREIDSLNLILCHIKDDQARKTVPDVVFDNLCMQQSLELGNEGAKELSSLVDELAEKIEEKNGWRKRLGSAKVVLKKEEIKKLKRRMKNAIRLLSLAYQCHTNAMIQLQPEIIVTRILKTMPSFTTITATSEETASYFQDTSRQEFGVPSNNLVTEQYRYWTLSPFWLRFLLGSLEYKSRYSKQNNKERQEIRVKYEVPLWLSSRAFEFKGHEMLSGWQLNFQTYRILPYRSSFFEYVKRGDVVCVRNMLATREALVTDRNWMGETALHVAAGQGHLEVCKLLLSEGAEILALNDYNSTPLHNVTSSAALLTFKKKGQPWDVCRLLINAGAIDTLIEDVSVLEGYHGDEPMFQYLQQTVYPPYYDRPLYQRLDICSKLSTSIWHSVPNLIRLAMGGSRINKAMVTCTDGKGATLLHCIVRGLACCTAMEARKPRKRTYRAEISLRTVRDAFKSVPDGRLDSKSEDGHHIWRELGREVIAAGASLHAINKDGRSPLCILIEEYTHQYYLGAEPADFPFNGLKNLLYGWLADLLLSGVDLQQYGEFEKHLHRAGKVNLLFKFRGYGYQRDLHFKLITFSYGPHLRDWNFWFSESTDRFAGKFWAMVENPEYPEYLDQESWDLPIPGSWIEDSEFASDSSSEYSVYGPFSEYSSEYSSECSEDGEDREENQEIELETADRG